MTDKLEIWAEFASAERLLCAATELERRGVKRTGAYTPFALPELEPGLGLARPRLIPRLVFCAALCGGGLSFLVIWWTAAVDYPLNIGGRPLNSLPADLPIVFESSILFAVITAFAAVLGLSGMPRLNHPLERLAGFARTSDDRYWLGIEVGGGVESREVGELLQRVGVLAVHGLPEGSS